MSTLNNIILITKDLILLAFLSPLVSGVIKKIKNILRMRKGPSILQPYYDARKLFLKDEVISKSASWVFYVTPPIVFMSSACALFFILMARRSSHMESIAAILIAAFFVLSLGRFFLALAGLDTAGAFGGMGASREMFISSFAEPTVIIAVFVLCMKGGYNFSVSNLLAALALFMAAIAETSRIPVDNQETHLELTMVHEAMVLEYSGKPLALIELAAHIKQMMFFVLLSWYLFGRLSIGAWGWLIFAAGIFVISLVIALLEISVAKMRLFRVVDFLSFAFFIVLVASIAAGLGL